MPHYHKYEWEVFHISARPSGIRKFMPRFIPYFTGSKPKLRVVIRIAGGKTSLLEASLFLIEPLAQTKEVWEKLSDPSKPFKDIDETWALHPIAESGDHRLQVRLVLSNVTPTKSVRYDLVTFKAIAQETMIGWTIGMLLAIGAIVVGILNLLYRL